MMRSSSTLVLAALLTCLRSSVCWAYEPVEDLPACVSTPPNTRFTCGKYGRIDLDNKRQFTYYNVTTLAACHLECVAQLSVNNQVFIPEPSCYSLGYNAQTQTCSGFYDTLRGSSFQLDDQSPVMFYDSQCFVCMYDTPAPAGSNILANGGFQTPTSSQRQSSPWFFNYNITSDGNIILDGGKVVSPGFCSTKALAEDHLEITQTYIEPPTRQFFDYTFDYKYQGFGNSKTFSILTGGDSSLKQPTTVNNNTWSKFKSTIQLGAYFPNKDWFARIAKLSIFGTITNVTTFIDNVKITPSKLPFRTKKGALNLVKNGDFELGSFEGFRLNFKSGGAGGKQNQTLSFVPSGEQGSKYALKFDPAKVKLDGFAPVLNFQLVQQNVTLKNGVDYIVGVKYRLAHASASCLKENDFSMILVVNDETGAAGHRTGTSVGFHIDNVESAQYTTYQVPLPSFSSYPYRNPARFEFWLDWLGTAGTPATCQLVVDEVFIKEKA